MKIPFLVTLISFVTCTLAGQSVPVTFHLETRPGDTSAWYLAGNITNYENTNAAFRLTEGTGDGILELTVNIDPAITPQVIYKFVPDGDWGRAIPDPDNPNDSGSPYFNSILDIRDPMITYLLPKDGSTDGTVGHIRAIIAHSASQVPVADKWELQINGTAVDNAFSYYQESIHELNFDPAALLQAGSNHIEISAGSLTRTITGKSTFTIRRNPDGWINSMILYEIIPYNWVNANGSAFHNISVALDNMVDLGINAIWLTPLEQGEGSGYAPTDYYTIQSSLGTETELKNLVSAAHQKGIRIIIDMVCNHTSKNHPWFQSCILKGAQSPYADYYLWNGVPGQSDYSYFYNWDYLPNLNVANPVVENALIDVAEYWTTRFDLDGFRFDVAWGVEQRSANFWKNMAKRLLKLRPDLFLLGEAPAIVDPGYEQVPVSPVTGKSILFDHGMNALYDWKLRWFSSDLGLPGVLNGKVSLVDLASILNQDYGEGNLPMRFMENHDLPRAAFLFGPERSKLSHALIFTVPGVPLLYEGAETGQTTQYGGICDDTDSLKPWFQKILHIRNQYILNNDQWIGLSNSSASGVFSYATKNKNGTTIVTLLNFTGVPANVTVDLTPLSGFFRAPFTIADLIGGTAANPLDERSLNAVPVSLNGYEARIFRFAGDLNLGIKEDLVTESSFSVYPNPATDGKCWITTNDLFLLPAELSVYNPVGVLVKQKKIDRLTTAVEISDLPDGMYLFKLKNNRTNAIRRAVFMRSGCSPALIFR